MSFEDFIATAVKCVSDFRYQTQSNDWLSSFRFTKPIGFVIDSHHLFPSSIVSLFSFKSALSLVVTIGYCIRFSFSHTFDHIDNFFIDFQWTPFLLRQGYQVSITIISFLLLQRFYKFGNCRLRITARRRCWTCSMTDWMLCYLTPKLVIVLFIRCAKIE